MKALFVREDSVYKKLIGEENCYDSVRDATTYTGNDVRVCHPPCRSWGVFHHIAKPRIGEPELAIWSVNGIIKHGGVLEHPRGSILFKVMNYQIKENGFLFKLNQFDFGHKALKSTTLFISGCSRNQLPKIKKREGTPTHVVATSNRNNKLPRLSPADREHTPRPFAEWIIKVCQIIETNKKTGTEWKPNKLF